MTTSRPNDQGCIPNIGPRGQRRRRIGAAVALAIGILGAIAFAANDASAPWRAALVLPFTLAALGYFQARERT